MGQIPVEISQLTRLVTLDLSSYFFHFLKLEDPDLQKLVQNLTSIKQLHLDSVIILAKGHEWSNALLALIHLEELSMAYCNLSGPIDSSLVRLENLTEISLEGNNLSSTVPETFAKFKSLSILSLEDCNLIGVFPSRIFQVRTLFFIDISYNEDLHGSLSGFPFNGALQTLKASYTSFSGVIPDSIGNLRHLSEMDLSGCKLNGTLPNSIANCTELKYLYLSNNFFIGPIPSSLFTMPSLEELQLSFNHFDGRIDDEFSKLNGTLPNSIANCTKLKYVDLSNNFFISPIPSSLFTMPSLEELQLSFNHFDGRIDDEFSKLNGTLPNSIANCTELKYLDLSNNFFISPIPSSLFTMPSLEELQLSFNHFDGRIDDEFTTFPSSNLKTLDLSNNQLEAIPLFIFKLNKLEDLYLSSNNFTAMMKLDMFQSLRNLTILDISCNDLSIDASMRDTNLSTFSNLNTVSLTSCKLREFPMFMRNHSSLTFLNLSNNQIHGLIPHWIWNLNLEGLDLSNNFLKGFEGSLLNLTRKFYVLDFHSNQLQGQIPDFGFGSIIYYLDYSSNNFNCVVPSNVGHSLTSTKFFSLSKNNFHGSIPHSLCNATYLEALDLSNNKIEGTIPRCLTHKKHLRVLDLGNNMLSGKIPNSFSNSCALNTLDLNKNKLCGLIPKSLANCKALEVLDLGNNQIEGPFLCLLKKISTLRVMILHANKLQGSLLCLNTNDALPVLQIVDLSFNNFSGLLPSKAFTTWEAMIHINVSNSKQIQFEVFTNSSEKYYQDSVEVRSKGLEMKFVKILSFLTSIDFSSNNFEGPIPRELMNLRGLHILNLSNNALLGQIPSSIENLQQLESLDL